MHTSALIPIHLADLCLQGWLVQSQAWPDWILRGRANIRLQFPNEIIEMAWDQEEDWWRYWFPNSTFREPFQNELVCIGTTLIYCRIVTCCRTLGRVLDPKYPFITGYSTVLHAAYNMLQNMLRNAILVGKFLEIWGHSLAGERRNLSRVWCYTKQLFSPRELISIVWWSVVILGDLQTTLWGCA